MMPRLRCALAIPAALILGLTACAASGAGSGDGGSGGGNGGDGSGAAAGGVACLVDRTWSLDLDDLVAQLATQLGETGMTVLEATASGSQTFEFASEGTAAAAIDSTFVLTVDGSGLALTVTQTHSGAPTGSWTDTGDGTLAFSDWDQTGYTIDNEISMDGAAVEMPLELPSSSFGGSTMTYECSGSTLTTTVPENTYTYRWTTED